MRNLARWSITLWLVVCAVMVQAQRMEAITMKGALPEQVLPLVQQVLKPGESVQVFRNQLIVMASDESLERVHEVLQEVDRPPRNLLIQVTDSLETRQQQRDVRLQGSVGNDNVRIHVNEPPHPGDDHASVSVRDSRTQQTGNIQQQLRAVEGYPAFVATGQQAVLPAIDGRGRRGVVTQTANQGFFATVRLQGGQVFIDISMSHDALDDARLNTRQTKTTVSGRLGDWIAVAGMTSGSMSSQTGIAQQGTGSETSTGQIYLKVTLAE